MRLKKPEIMKKEQLMICVPAHVVRVLRTVPDKSEIISELLLENMDRINGGDILNAKKAREVEIRNIVSDVLRQDETLMQESLYLTSTLQQVKASLQEMRGTSDISRERVRDIASMIASLSKSVESNNVQESLVDRLTSRIFERTEQLANEMFDI